MAGNERGPGKPGPKFEESDVEVWQIGRFVVILIAVIAGMTGGRPKVANERVNSGQSPPQPRLETAPVVDLRKIREAEDQSLTSYGWIDRKNGVVRIPIARAIDMLAERGLPARRETEPETKAAGVSLPTESGLGPKMTPPGGPLAGDMK
jgi:hypothetical protein